MSSHNTSKKKLFYQFFILITFRCSSSTLAQQPWVGLHLLDYLSSFCSILRIYSPTLIDSLEVFSTWSIYLAFGVSALFSLSSVTRLFFPTFYGKCQGNFSVIAHRIFSSSPSVLNFTLFVVKYNLLFLPNVFRSYWFKWVFCILILVLRN